MLFLVSQFLNFFLVATSILVFIYLVCIIPKLYGTLFNIVIDKANHIQRFYLGVYLPQSYTI